MELNKNFAQTFPMQKMRVQLDLFLIFHQSELVNFLSKLQIPVSPENKKREGN